MFAKVCSIDTTATNAIQQAAELLRTARRPLICGLGGVSNEAAREAVALADRLGACVDWTASDADAAAMIAFQTVGGVGMTWGEALERADLWLCWRASLRDLPGSDQVIERMNLTTPPIVNVGGGCSSEGTPIRLDAGADYEAIAVLRALAKDIELDAAQVESDTGTPLRAWRDLLDRIKQSELVGVIRGPEVAQQGHATVAALTSLIQELQSFTRVVSVPLPDGGNHPGAENVLAWQTGFPMSVCLGKGYPRYGPGEFATEKLLARGEVDAVLVLDAGLASRLSFEAREALFGIPVALLASELVEDGLASAAKVVIETAAMDDGGGTYSRSDGATLRLPRDDSQLSAESVVKEIHSALTATPAV